MGIGESCFHEDGEEVVSSHFPRHCHAGLKKRGRAGRQRSRSMWVRSSGCLAHELDDPYDGAYYHVTVFKSGACFCFAITMAS